MRPRPISDATVSYGLGLRWSFMGPFETIDLNAPGGLDDYAAVSSPFTIPLHNREKTRGAGRHRLSKEQIRSAAIFFQKIACLHDGIGATACSCASSVTFGVAVPQTLDEWRTRLRSLAPPAGSEPLCVSNILWLYLYDNPKFGTSHLAEVSAADMGRLRDRTPLCESATNQDWDRKVGEVRHGAFEQDRAPAVRGHQGEPDAQALRLRRKPALINIDLQKAYTASANSPPPTRPTRSSSTT